MMKLTTGIVLFLSIIGVVVVSASSDEPAVSVSLCCVVVVCCVVFRTYYGEHWIDGHVVWLCPRATSVQRLTERHDLWA
jgi:hypothetical protein